MNAQTCKALATVVAVTVFALAYLGEGRAQDDYPKAQSSIVISLVTAETYAGKQPLKALAPMGEIRNMASLVKAPNVPDDALTGTTDFNDKGVGMVSVPEKYVSLVIKLAVSVRSKTRIKASDLLIIDSQKTKYLGTLWDDGLHAWVCSGVEYEPGQYEDYVIASRSRGCSRGRTRATH